MTDPESGAVEAGDPRVLRILDDIASATGFRIVLLALLRAHGDYEFVELVGDDEARGVMVGHHLEAAGLAEELALADVEGPLCFVPAERQSGGALDWLPAIEKLKVADAWHPEDFLFVLLNDDAGAVRGYVAFDAPHDGRRPGAAERRRLIEQVQGASGQLLEIDERQRATRQIDLAERSRAVIRSADAEQGTTALLAACGPVMAEALAAEAIWLVDLRSRHTVLARPGEPGAEADPADPGLLPFELARRVARQLWADARVLVHGDYPRVEDALDLPDHDALTAWLRVSDSHRVLLVPLGVGETLLGLMALTRRRGSVDWTDLEQDAARELGHDLGLALRTAGVFDAERATATAKRQLLAIITHELQSPIAAISGNVELLHDELDPGPLDLDFLAERLAAMERSTQRLSRLVHDLLGLSAAESTDRAPGVPLDLVEVARTAVDWSADAAAAKGQDLRLEVPDHPLRVVAHLEDLERVLSNLVSNAVKYTPVGGTVAVQVTRRARRVELSVRDTGIGIAAADLERLFEEFYRSGDPAARAEAGSGLGLAIVDRIVRRLGGSISVRSEPGQGSEFLIDLPEAADD
ncbi:sensor histidine kinase [Nocardioides sp.]|uniref:sensor histidine kinase n=1 Tax=Nocardioides sp. TaxID=35761 RepID=UPI003516E790